ncbi:MAG TPA: biotin carboxylase N-terminal domain-containing protein [Micromonosporaceae bacterium]
MIRRLLVANRGEIARRVFATCRAMGIETVAVCSDADADAPHAREADWAVRLPGLSSADTYLRGDLIVAAALRAGADAVHPGYGFLAENADFATAVTDAGLCWIGPPAKAIAAMGSKLEAKAMLAEAGVPMLPSWVDPAEVERFPVLIKASAGGGGRGMRIAWSADELPDAVAAASREALAAFGDPTVFCERYVAAGRHIEVQVFADSNGNVIALGERECSIQRRHQKIVEETPSPAVDEALREQLCTAAVAAARAVGYVGAGTVEFLFEPARPGADGTEPARFYFLEMNTRLQVEHPVTECVTGLDLVRWQLLVAQGEPLPLTEPPPARGHAIEVRLYAEDPRHGWRPSAGTLHRFDLPGPITAFATLPAPGIRVDSGVAEGSVVSVHYDPMLAKVIAWAPTRTEAARSLADQLRRSRVHGVITNRDLLVRVLTSAAFLAGQTDTGFLDQHPEAFSPLLEPDQERLAALAAALAGAARRRRDASWAALPAGWRNLPSAPQQISYHGPHGVHTIGYTLDRSGRLTHWRDTLDGTPGSPTPDVTVLAATPELVRLECDGLVQTFTVRTAATTSYVDCAAGTAVFEELPRFSPPVSERPAGSLIAPMPGAVGRMAVTVGQRVNAGDVLLTLEAMKLEHLVHAPESGTVTELHVQTGSQVDAGALLAVITADAEPADPAATDTDSEGRS